VYVDGADRDLGGAYHVEKRLVVGRHDGGLEGSPLEPQDLMLFDSHF
jgi:hypothetical protein